jgi:hypothetical protein
MVGLDDGWSHTGLEAVDRLEDSGDAILGAATEVQLWKSLNCSATLWSWEQEMRL